MKISKMPTINCKSLLAFLFFPIFLSACSSTKKTTSSPGNLSSAQRKKFANIMQVSPKDIRNEKLYAFISDWWGVKYKYGGNTKSGVDCSGFVVQLYKTIYGQSVVRSSSQQYEASKHVKKARLDEGDLVFFATNGKGIVSHVGIYLMKDYFVHANKNGVVINHLDDPYWKPRFISGGKLK